MPQIQRKDPYKLVGTTFDSRFLLTEFVDEGGMGAIYKAEDIKGIDTVALKILSPRHQIKPRFLDYFKKEANILNQLDHPNIVKIIAIGVDSVSGMDYFVMES